MSDWQQDVETVRHAVARLMIPDYEALVALDRLAARIEELEGEREDAYNREIRRANEAERERDEAREALQRIEKAHLRTAIHLQSAIAITRDALDDEEALVRAAAKTSAKALKEEESADLEPRPPADTDRHPPQAMNEHDPRL